MPTKLAAVLVSVALLAACGDSGEKSTPTTPTTEAIFPPKVDEPARPGTVENADGAAVELAAAWTERRVVLVFYRGNW